MCCCGCPIAVLEPGAGFGIWRALFGWGGTRQAKPPTETNDVMTRHVVTVAPRSSQAACADEGDGEKAVRQVESEQTKSNGDRT
jgi:hypothetical protein